VLPWQFVMNIVDVAESLGFTLLSLEASQARLARTRGHTEVRYAFDRFTALTQFSGHKPRIRWPSWATGKV
jgi:hypothetical protein